MNLIITNECNRACPYCFAREKVTLVDDGKGAIQEHISLDEVATYLDFLECSNIKEFKILGGEPTVHPRFSDIVDAGLSHRFNFNVIVFTNGLWPDQVNEFFTEPRTSNVEFVVNVNEPHVQKLWENVAQEKSLHIAGNRARISYNIFQEDFDLLFAADLIEKHNLSRNIRIGLASPIANSGNDYAMQGSLKHIGSRLVEQFRKLEKRDILCGLDCGFPLCMFSKQDLGALTLCSHGFSSQCDIIIDVGPDLTTWPCFPLSQLLNVKLTDYPDADALRSYYRHKLSTLRRLGSRDECLTCKYLRRNQCCGGCLSRTLINWQNTGDKNIIDKINAAI